MTPVRKIKYGSKEYVKIAVSDPGNAFDASLFQARVGGGEWVATTVLESGLGTARVAFLCSPADDGIEPGNHEVEVRTVDNPEAPLLTAGILTVTS